MTTLDYLPVLDLADTLFARKFDPETDATASATINPNLAMGSLFDHFLSLGAFVPGVSTLQKLQNTLIK